MKLNGKTFLITGSTDGVGRHVALELGAAGATVLLHGRSRERADEVISEIRKHGNSNAIFYPADLSSLQQVRALAETVRRNHDRLDVLINNAGIGSRSGGPQRRTSADGHELRFAVNYLAGFLLTRLLLPLIVASAPARIVNVASAGQFPIDFDDVMLTRGYDGGRAYTQSKLAQVMFTFDLARELDGDRRHRQLPASRDLHGHDHGARERRLADQHRQGRRGCGPQPRACRTNLQDGRGFTSIVSGYRGQIRRPTTRPRGGNCAR